MIKEEAVFRCCLIKHKINLFINKFLYEKLLNSSSMFTLKKFGIFDKNNMCTQLNFIIHLQAIASWKRHLNQFVLCQIELIKDRWYRKQVLKFLL